MKFCNILKKVVPCLLIVFLLVGVLCSCSENTPTQNDVPAENKTESKSTVPNYNASPTAPNDAHYVSFYVDNILVEKMLVLSGETYETLSDYFPTIPEKEGKTAKWEVVDKVFDEKVKDIRINAVYEDIG